MLIKGNQCYDNHGGSVDGGGHNGDIRARDLHGQVKIGEKRWQIKNCVCCGSRSGKGAFLTPGSGMDKKSRSGSGIRIRDEHPGSYFRELRNNFWVKILKGTVQRDGSGQK